MSSIEVLADLDTRWDCIRINDRPVSEHVFKKVEGHVLALDKRENIQASEFELLTATAFQLFNDHKVDVGVVEVGMGGKLDATNILNNQVVSVIAKIAHDHQSFLGNTLQEIATHKAGILRPNIPYIVNPTNKWNVHKVIDDVAQKVGAGPRLHGDTEQLRETLYVSKEWMDFSNGLCPFQKDNAVLAYLAVTEALKSLGEPIQALQYLLPGIKSRKILGRFQRTSARAVFGSSGEKILIDGAHNEDAAEALNEYIQHNLRRHPIEKTEECSTSKTLLHPPKDGWPLTWVVAMSAGKDAHSVLKHLLKSGDNVVVTSFGPVDGMPWVKPMDPNDILKAAEEVTPGISGIAIPELGAHRALCAAKYLADQPSRIILTGSLYFISDFLREKAAWKKDESAFDFSAIDEQERNRIYHFLSPKIVNASHGTKIQDAMTTEERGK